MLMEPALPSICSSTPIRFVESIGHGPFAYGFRIGRVRGDLGRRGDFRHFPLISDRNQVADEQAVRIRLVRFFERERVRVVSREGLHRNGIHRGVYDHPVESVRRIVLTRGRGQHCGEREE